GQLGGFRSSEIPDSVAAIEIGAIIEAQRRLVELDSSPRAFVIAATDKLWVSLQIGEDPSREHSLRAMTHEHVGAHTEPRQVLEHRGKAIPRRSHRECGLVADEATWQ